MGQDDTDTGLKRSRRSRKAVNYAELNDVYLPPLGQDDYIGGRRRGVAEPASLVAAPLVSALGTRSSRRLRGGRTGELYSEMAMKRDEDGMREVTGEEKEEEEEEEEVVVVIDEEEEGEEEDTGEAEEEEEEEEDEEEEEGKERKKGRNQTYWSVFGPSPNHLSTSGVGYDTLELSSDVCWKSGSDSDTTSDMDEGGDEGAVLGSTELISNSYQRPAIGSTRHSWTRIREDRLELEAGGVNCSQASSSGANLPAESGSDMVSPPRMAELQSGVYRAWKKGVAARTSQAENPNSIVSPHECAVGRGRHMAGKTDSDSESERTLLRPLYSQEMNTKVEEMISDEHSVLTCHCDSTVVTEGEMISCNTLVDHPQPPTR